LLLAQRTADATVKDAVERATTEANRARVALLAEITELEGRRDKLTRYVTGLDETFAKRQQWLLDTLDRFRKAVEEGDLQDMIADNPVASWDEQLGLDSANMSPLAAILSVPDKA
jgi:predicted  nucleic acid-binding Zn-ribbon protein